MARPSLTVPCPPLGPVPWLLPLSEMFFPGTPHADRQSYFRSSLRLLLREACLRHPLKPVSPSSPHSAPPHFIQCIYLVFCLFPSTGVFLLQFAVWAEARSRCSMNVVKGPLHVSWALFQEPLVNCSDPQKWAAMLPTLQMGKRRCRAQQAQVCSRALLATIMGMLCHLLPSAKSPGHSS